MIKWGQKSKPKKIPCWIPDPSKFSEELRSQDMRELSQIFRFVLNTQKSLLKSSYPKNTCQNFLTPKNPEIRNFKPQKIPRSSRSLEIQSTPWAPVYIVYPQTLDEPVCIICFLIITKCAASILRSLLVKHTYLSMVPVPSRSTFSAWL